MYHDDRGVYRIYGLPAGHYKVSVGSDPPGARHPSACTPTTGKPFFWRRFRSGEGNNCRAKRGWRSWNIDIQVGNRGETYAATDESSTQTQANHCRVRYCMDRPEDPADFFGGLHWGAVRLARRISHRGDRAGPLWVTLAIRF